VIGDGHLGIWGALRNVYPHAAEQRCWNQKIVNVLDKLPKSQHAVAAKLLGAIPRRRPNSVSVSPLRSQRASRGQGRSGWAGPPMAF